MRAGRRRSRPRARRPRARPWRAARRPTAGRRRRRAASAANRAQAGGQVGQPAVAPGPDRRARRAHRAVLREDAPERVPEPAEPAAAGRRLVAHRLAAREARGAPLEQPDARSSSAGCRIVSTSPPMPGGAADPDRHLEDLAAELGGARQLRAPPVRMIPAGSMPVTAAARISLRISSNVSRIRASMIWQTSSRLTVRPASSPRTETLISSSSVTARRSHVPWRTLSSSATWRLVLSPIATSLVTLLPPTGRTRGVERRAVLEQREVDRAGADVGDRDAELLLGLGQDRLGRGERVDHELVDLDARPRRRTWTGSGPRSRTP